MIDKGNFIDNFNDECVSFIMGIGNNINKDENVNKNNNGNNTVIFIILDINNDKEIKVNFITDF